MMSELAIHGGPKVREAPVPTARTTGEEEVQAGVRVLRSGLLSGFAASSTDDFLGGPEVRGLEAEWQERFQVDHAVACNSATSALLMAVGAVGVGPGDEVVVSPYTMSATSTVVLFYGGVPVFADIELDTFCLDPVSVEARITPRTKAIMAVDIHGQSSDVDALLEMGRRHGIPVIFDSAQAAGSTYHGTPTGTLGAIGIYSLNRHKNMQCGEGGVAVTRDPELALRMQLIRNHGESVIPGGRFVPKDLTNMVGLNLRMTELEASVAREQLKKMEALNGRRIDNAMYLAGRLADNPVLTPPKIRHGCTHVFYMQALLYDDPEMGVPRKAFVDAVRAEGIPVWGGYLKPLYLDPVYQKRTAIGSRGFPFDGPHYDGEARYDQGLCPVAEDLYDNHTIINAFLYHPLERKDMDHFADAFNKVADGRAKLLED